MTPSRPLRMTEQGYRDYPAPGSTILSAFYNKGVYSPDHALMKLEYKSYFEYGRMLETMLQDATKGTDTFKERFYITSIDGKMPDEMISWIDNKEDLSQYYVYTKDGKPNGTYKTRHAFLDEAMANPGKIPVSKQDSDLLNRHRDNMLRMIYMGATVEQILKNAEWQVPVVFTDYDGIEKKGLFDVLVNLGDEYVLIDLKTTASFQKFGYMLRDKYWIQDILYTNAVNAEFGYCSGMVFFAASKEAPFLCQPFQIDYGGTDFRAHAVEEFFKLCEAFKAWRDDGKKPRGYLPLEVVKKYPKI